MGVYELINGDDKAAPANLSTLVLAVDVDDHELPSPRKDLEAGAGQSGSPEGDASADARMQRLVSLDVFRGLTVAVCARINCFRLLLPFPLF